MIIPGASTGSRENPFTLPPLQRDNPDPYPRNIDFKELCKLRSGGVRFKEEDRIREYVKKGYFFLADVNAYVNLGTGSPRSLGTEKIDAVVKSGEEMIGFEVKFGKVRAEKRVLGRMKRVYILSKDEVKDNVIPVSIFLGMLDIPQTTELKVLV